MFNNNINKLYLLEEKKKKTPIKTTQEKNTPKKPKTKRPNRSTKMEAYMQKIINPYSHNRRNNCNNYNCKKIHI